MYAVIVDRNRQYRAAPGDTLTIDRCEAELGATLEWPVLLLADAGAIQVGAPFVAGAKATVKVVEHTLGDKLYIGKYKRRKHMSNRRKGFRHCHSVVQVVSISA